MFKPIRILLILFISFFIFQSCSKGPFGGDHAANMEKLDKLYGPCNNPHRKIVGRDARMLCEDKQRAVGPGGKEKPPISITNFAKNFNREGGVINYQGMAINPFLWQASLELLDEYPLRIVDSQGGVISTDWIIENTSPNQRCNVKITIKSQELVSNGVKVKLICQQKTDDAWYNDNSTYLDDEKDLTLKILEIANQIKVQDQLS